MSLSSLAPLFSDSELKENVDHEQITVFYKHFVEDFIDNPFRVGGKDIKIYHSKPKVAEFKDYCETFYHVVTKRSLAAGGRYYEAKRANRIHWIKPILLSHPCKQVRYYKWKDDDGICKEHFWYFNKDFMVVMKEVSTNLYIVTAFCVETERDRALYNERWDDYKNGKTC